MERRDQNGRGRYAGNQVRGSRPYDYDGEDAYAPIGGGRQSRQPSQQARRQRPQQRQIQPERPQQGRPSQPQQSQGRRYNRPPQQRPQGQHPQQRQTQRQAVPMASQPMVPSTAIVRSQAGTPVPMTGSANPYSTRSGRPDAPKKKSVLKPLLVILLILLLAGGVVAGVLLLHKPEVSVTVNGQEAKVAKDSSLADVKSKLEIETTPGRLLAVDGSVIDEKGGTEQTVTVNGSELTDDEYADFKFTANGTTVKFGDGKDETETFTSTEEKEPYATFDTSDMTLNDYWTGSIHLFQHGQEGVKTTKKGDVSGIEVTEETQPRQDEKFVIYTAQPPAGEKVVALTFDDGPWEDSTEEILDILEQNDAKATFFTVGQQVAEHAAQVKRAKDLGCLILTHTWDHAAGSGQGVNLTYMSPDEQVEEVQKGYGALSDLFGEEPLHMFRAPGGNFYGSIVDTLKPYVDAEFGWDVDTEDWKKPGSDTIYERIMTVRSGQIVLMHDGGGNRSQTVAAVRRAVPELKAQGYRFVTVDELLQYGVPEGR